MEAQGSLGFFYFFWGNPSFQFSNFPKFENSKEGKRLLQTRWDQSHFFVGLSWIVLFTTFPMDSRCIKFEYITPCILTHLLTINKVRHAQGSTTITFDELFLILNKILKENIFNFNEYKTIPLRSLIGTDKCPNHERVNLQISKSVYHSSYLETVSGTVRF